MGHGSGDSRVQEQLSNLVPGSACSIRPRHTQSSLPHLSLRETKDFHPAVESYIYDIEDVHPVFSGSLAITCRDVHPAMVEYAAMHAWLENDGKKEDDVMLAEVRTLEGRRSSSRRRRCGSLSLSTCRLRHGCFLIEKCRRSLRSYRQGRQSLGLRPKGDDGVR